jgi:hypothetical protein
LIFSRRDKATRDLDDNPPKIRSLLSNEYIPHLP